jgi:hypothetical protein
MKLLCNLNLFALEQTIYAIDDSGTVNPVAAVELEQLPEIITAMIGEYSATKVVLSGSGSYASTIAEEIKNWNTSHYNHNIEIEVI